MIDRNITSVTELLEILLGMKPDLGWAFRGQRDVTWSLLPKAGRPEFSCKYKASMSETTILDSWKRYAIPYIDQQPQSNGDWLVLAQHHGLATRLLDWTKNPLTAAFFAIYGNTGTDASLFGFQALKSENVDGTDPFNIKSFGMFFPNGLTARVISQRSLFSISPIPNSPIENHLKNRLYRLIIPAAMVPELKQSLETLGVNILSIYPDLDHLSEHLNDVLCRLP